MKYLLFFCVGLPAAFLLEEFGKMFFDFCKESGYTKILKVLGANTQEFLQNLDALHDHLATIYPGMQAPSFRCSNENGALILHYYSDRPGLESIVVGIVKTVAKNLHNSEVDVKVLKTKEECDHVQFVIIEKGAKAVVDEHNDNKNVELRNLKPKISPATFCRAFPFHILFDKNMVIKQTGFSLARVVPRVSKGNCKIDDVFEMIRPHMAFDFNHILSHINTVYVLRTREEICQADDNANKLDHQDSSRMRLKGQMVFVPESDLLLFMCSPSVTSLDDLSRRGLFLSDIPLHDSTRDLVCHLRFSYNRGNTIT